jgi:hypothetical protein
MKKILYFIMLCSYATYAQTVTECPFAAKKYVHYDGIITSTNTIIPMNYSQLIMNNNSYSRGDVYLEQPAQADCFYKTSIHNHDSIKKPFVFVEGISFEKKVANSEQYTLGKYFRQDYYPEPPPTRPECLESFNSAPQYHGYNVGHSTFNWATLVTGIDAEGYYANDPLKVEKAPELLNQLCCAGYDICFVDFYSGEEYIESNGEALYSILVKLHDQLVENNSSEKMVVCGASMGGLVARYAINKLEAEGHTDWVEKFVSFDSPQMGANIPLSLQYTLKHLKGLGDDVEEKYKKLTCPSASQLVNYSCLETNLLSPIVYTTPSPSIERTEMLNNPYMGWPQHCIKIAISNGSRLGLTQSFFHAPGDQVLDVDGIFDIDLYALPQNESSYQKVFDFDLPACVLASSPALSLLGITQQSVRVKNTMALDLAPGSFRKDLQEIESGLPNILTNVVGQLGSACSFNWINNSNNADKLCFIPILSSIGAINYETIMKAPAFSTAAILDIKFGTDNKFEDFDHQFSNFDIVYAPEQNQSHVEITDENIGWLIDVIVGVPENVVHQNRFITSATFKASNFIIAGNNVFDHPICGTTVYNGVNMADPTIPCGDAVVANNEAVFYKAGNFIELMPGFVTGDDVVFQAEIIHFPACYSSGRVAPNIAQSNNANNNNGETEVLNNSTKAIKIPEKTLQLYPNPSSDYCDISSHEIIENVSINSLMGTLVTQQAVNEFSYRLATNELANGVYLVHIKTSNEMITKKLIVKHE